MGQARGVAGRVRLRASSPPSATSRRFRPGAELLAVAAEVASEHRAATGRRISRDELGRQLRGREVHVSNAVINQLHARLRPPALPMAAPVNGTPVPELLASA